MASNLVGRVIQNRYRVERFLDAGGMGVVYQVWDQQRGAWLAMKTLYSELAEDEGMLHRLQREADALMKLSHPRIVPFYGIERTAEAAFILEAFIDGPTLKQILAQRKLLAAEETLAYLKPVCAALGYAHNNHTVHCDVKPSNVMVDQGGTVYLTDFGITRSAGSAVTTTVPTSGTPAYMPPEQARGDMLSPAADIYALGVMAFEMLAGRRPFLGSEAVLQDKGANVQERLVYAHAHLPAPDPRASNPALPTAISPVLLKALEKDPGRRYQTTQEFFQALCLAARVSPESIPEHVFLADDITMDSGAPTLANPAGPQATKSLSVRAISLKALSPRIIGVIAAGLVVVAAAVFLLARPPGPDGKTPAPPPATEASAPTAAVVAAREVTAASAPTAAAPATAAPESTVTAVQAAGIGPTATRTLAPQASATAQGYKAALYEPIPGCARSHVHANDWVMITFGKDYNSIRSTADTHPTDNKIGRAEPGELIYVTGGPVCNYGWLLWEVRTSAGLKGWTPETDGKEFFIEPFPSREACPGAAPSLINKGDEAQVTLFPPVTTRVRAAPGTSAERIGSIDPGELVQVTDGPKCADGYVWWQIEAKNGLTGWAAEGQVNNYFLVPVPKQH